MKQQILEEESRQLKAEIKALSKPNIGELESVSLIKVMEAYTHWLFNADLDFIEKAWQDNQWIAEHLKSKLTGIIGNDGFMSTADLAHFDRELDDTNREILYRYILENHLNKW